MKQWMVDDLFWEATREIAVASSLSTGKNRTFTPGLCVNAPADSGFAKPHSLEEPTVPAIPHFSFVIEPQLANAN